MSPFKMFLEIHLKLFQICLFCVSSSYSEEMHEKKDAERKIENVLNTERTFAILTFILN